MMPVRYWPLRDSRFLGPHQALSTPPAHLRPSVPIRDPTLFSSPTPVLNSPPSPSHLPCISFCPAVFLSSSSSSTETCSAPPLPFSPGIPSSLLRSPRKTTATKSSQGNRPFLSSTSFTRRRSFSRSLSIPSKTAPACRKQFPPQRQQTACLTSAPRACKQSSPNAGPRVLVRSLFRRATCHFELPHRSPESLRRRPPPASCSPSHGTRVDATLNRRRA